MNIKHLSLLTTLLALLASCSSSKTHLTYFEDIQKAERIVDLPPTPTIKIAPDDELFITVNSEEPKATINYNLPMANAGIKAATNMSTAPQQQTYLVNSMGDIDFPILGTIHVAGMTTEELQRYLVERISKDVENPNVMVSLVNFNISVLGEVTLPGVVKVTRNRFSILDALASCNDMTPYGERSNVLLIRENNGKQERVILDLNSSDLLTSPYYYLQPNDYIYVAPNNIRKGNAKYDQSKSYNVQVTSTIVSAASVIASLIIALAVNR